MRVLYVEDDRASQKLLVKGLGAEGVDVEVADNGTKAIEMLRSRLYDVLILDIMMPGIDGLQVGRSARKEAKNKDIPIILLTAHPYALRESGAKKLKPVASLTKPVKLEKLMKALRELQEAK